MASNMQKPDGLVILPVDRLPRAILHLSLRDIPGIGPNMTERLQVEHSSTEIHERLIQLRHRQRAKQIL